VASGIGAGGDLSLLGLYIHVPFCARRCDYCDFYVVVGREEETRRFTSVTSDRIRATGRLLARDELQVDSIYMGGGTPSRLAASQLEELLVACREGFQVARDAEITLEANPEGIEPAALRAWKAAGINRLSIGVQDLDDEVLRRRGRAYTGARAKESIRLAREEGFDNLNVDLIAGLPGGGEPVSREPHARRLAGVLQGVLEEIPQHLSIYLLETDKQTPLMHAVREGAVALPSPDEVAEAFLAAAEMARDAGYEHYEISNFCLPGKRSRHNLKYWTGEPYLGFGASAHSFFGDRRYATARDLDAYLGQSAGAEFGDGGSGLDYTLEDREAAAREALILNLRLLEGVDLDRFDRRWRADSRRWVEEDLGEALEAGLLELRKEHLRLTERGILLANEVFSRIHR
jgi:oxygen-independent coproporphyrinogen-3 oxidase